MIDHPVNSRSAIVHIDIDRAGGAVDVELDPQIEVVGLVARRADRVVDFVFVDIDAESPPATPRGLLARHRPWLEIDSAINGAFEPDQSWKAPSVTAAICTRERPERLRRLLSSLAQLDPAGVSPRLEVLVVDNAPVGDDTRRVVEEFDEVRYVCEPRAGLDFARNRALAETGSDVLAFLDDDVVVDPGWFRGLLRLCRTHPDAGGFTGLVMPYALETHAQIAFERNGGFGRGPQPRRLASRLPRARLFPVGAGEVGAGCNMAFDRALLESIGGFDIALDTGAPLPGGGDLDAFFRVLVSGRPIGYDPAYAVYHEHRQSDAELRHQYYTWGLGMMAFLRKVSLEHPEYRNDVRRMRWWWLSHLMGELRASRSGGVRTSLDVFSEFRGGVIGVAGEYERSQRRSAAIDAAAQLEPQLEPQMETRRV